MFVDEVNQDFQSKKIWQKIIQHFTDNSYKNKMKTYCLKCKKDTENLDSKIFKTKSNRLIMQSKCTDCGNKKSRFVKEPSC